MSKFNSVKTTVDGITFHSLAESERYMVLKLLRFTGDISDLRLQVPYEIIVNGQKICKYIADFVYTKNGNVVVEDVKGFPTAVYKLKKKLMKAVHGIEIQEVK